MTEIRWHARAGQGAKTAAQLLAEALLRAGKSVQAFPEYGPERRGAPVRAYTRVSDRTIRRHDPITEPDVVVVLEPALARDPSVTDGLAADGLLLLNAEEPPIGVTARRVRCVPADRLAAASGARFANVVMLGAVAAVLGEPPLEQLEEAAVAALGRKSTPDAVLAGVREGFAWAS
jgi:2-oxoacid:acceptor oxidoreductase gamma subunit (pyruvate/2-ketoisovalerate family)